MSGILKRSQKSGSSFNLAATSQTYFINKQRNVELQSERINDRLNEFKAKYRSMCSQDSLAKASDSSPSEYTNTEAITRVSIGDASPLRIQITNSRSSHATSVDAPQQLEKDFFISGISTPSGTSPRRSNTPRSNRPMIFKYNYSPAQTDRTRCLSNRNLPPKSPDIFKSKREKVSAVKMLPRINIETLVTQVATTPQLLSERDDTKSIENQNELFLRKCFSSANIGMQIPTESNTSNKVQVQRKVLFSPSKNHNLGATAASAMFGNKSNDLISSRKHSDPTITTTHAASSASGENCIENNGNTIQLKQQTSQPGDYLNFLGKLGTDEIARDQIESQETERSKMLKEYARTQIGGRFKSPFRHPSIQRKVLESDEKIMPKSQKKVTFTDDEANNTKMNDEKNFQNHLLNLDYNSHSAEKSKQIRELIDSMIRQSNQISTLEKTQSEVKRKKLTYEGFHKKEALQQFKQLSSMKISQSIGENQLGDSAVNSKSPVKSRESITANSPSVSLLNRKDTRQISILNHERSKSENIHNSYNSNVNVSTANIQNTPQEAVLARNGSILRTSSIHSEKQISERNINAKRKESQLERQSTINSSQKDDFQRLKDNEKAQEIVESVFTCLSKINTLRINRVKIAKFFDSFLSRNSPIYCCIFNNQNELRGEFSQSHLEKIFAAHNTNPNGQLQSCSNIFHEFVFLENKMEEFLLENQISDCVKYKQGIIDDCLSLQDVALKMRQPYQNQALNTLSGLSCNRMVNKQHSIVDSLNTATIKFGKLGHISPTQLKMNQAIEKQIQSILDQRQSQIKALQIFPVQQEDS